MEWRIPDNIIATWAEFACLVCIALISQSVLATAGFAGDVPRDTLVVNGSSVAYEAQVSVDTLKSISPVPDVDWWFGVGVDFTWPQSFEQDFVPLSALGTTRPFFRMERRHSGKKGRWGVHCTYHQPWNLAEAEISPHVKGWVLDGDSPMLSFPSLQQVLLIPDSLAFERDTLQAPISAGHALRIGGSWERLSSAKWHLWLAGSMTVIRPSSWQLSPPGDPATWRGTSPTDTYARDGWFARRSRLDVGALTDVGRSHRGRRSASQLRISMFADSGKSWGGRVMLLVSPTRR